MSLGLLIIIIIAYLPCFLFNKEIFITKYMQAAPELGLYMYSTCCLV